jgi:hypothetical protein
MANIIKFQNQIKEALAAGCCTWAEFQEFMKNKRNK